MNDVKYFLGEDMYHIFTESIHHGLWTTAIPSIKSSIKLLKEETQEIHPSNGTLHIFQPEKLNLTMLEDQLNQAINYHDQHLLRWGSRSPSRHLFTKPLGKKLTKEQRKMIKKREKKSQNLEILRTDEIEDPYNQRFPADHYVNEDQKFKLDLQKEQLCRGQTFKVSSQYSNAWWVSTVKVYVLYF